MNCVVLSLCSHVGTVLVFVISMETVLKESALVFLDSMEMIAVNVSKLLFDIYCISHFIQTTMLLPILLIHYNNSFKSSENFFLIEYKALKNLFDQRASNNIFRMFHT